MQKKRRIPLQVIKKPVPLQRFNKQLIVLLKKFHTTMKKLVFVFAAFAAISFASCGNSQAPAEAADSVTVDSIADSVAVDSVAADTTVVDTVNA
ncbi:MAG: hypothetical protein ACI353_03195 [Alloprevotella sp.]